MIRLGIGLILALSACGLASADDVLPIGRVAKSPTNARCKALGEGFFPVAGSDACIRISGYVAAGADFGGGSAPAWHAAPRFDSSSAAVMRTGGGVSLDARFDTPMGPGRIYVDSGYNHFGP